MKLWLKILIVFVFLIIAVIGTIVYLFNKQSKVETLSIHKKDSTEIKVDKAKLWLTKIHKQAKFNGAVLLIKNDSVLINRTYGFKDYSKKEKLTNQSSFRLASVSKQFTATGIMLLKEKGLLSFDDKITKYLPKLTYNNVSLRNLLNHTSGIPDVYMSFPKKYKKEIGEFLTIQKTVSLLSKENLPLKNTPNEKYSYNNTGYVLLAAIIERISETSFENFMEKELFEKLKMKNTRVWNLASENKYFLNKTGSFENFMGEITELRPSVLDGVAGDGGVFSSVNDMVIWNKFWYENDLLSKETMQEAFKRPILNNGTISNYGFGWIVTENAMWHNGSWLGARTLIVRNTKLKNTLILLDNSSSTSLDNINRELTKVYR